MTARVEKISKQILRWSEENPRHLPWKKDKDPYKIWISEIILQQTRVAQGIPYYHRFLSAFPTIKDLATAELDAVYKQWEGLGYYRRARHLHTAAQTIYEKHNGEFPNTYEQIKQLKGIGPYTAAAISSFAFDLPRPVIDGNVNRVVGRLFAIAEEIDSKEGMGKIKSAVQAIFDEKKPAAFNQAIMDFGALQCVPVNPSCDRCPLKNHCQAYLTDRVQQIPTKKPKKKRRVRFFLYLLICDGDYVWIRRRQEEDIWQHLYEFFLIESNKALHWSVAKKSMPVPLDLLSISDNYQQILTHQKIYATFARVQIKEAQFDPQKLGFKRVRFDQLREYAFPKIIDCYLGDKAVNLNLAF